MTKEIPLTQGKVAIVDDDAHKELSQYNWHFVRGYAQRWAWVGGKRKKIYMHRVVLGTPEEMQTDHRDGNKLNNQRDNLRVCTPSENRCNRGRTIVNTSGFKGVTWDRSRNKWKAQVELLKNKINVGRFDTAEAAARAYDEAAKKLHGQFAKLNFSSTENENGN